VKPNEIQVEDILNISRLGSQTPGVDGARCMNFLKSVLPILNVSLSGPQEVVRTEMLDSITNLSVLSSVCKMMNVCVFLQRLQGAIAAKATVRPGGLGVINSPAGDMIALIHSGRTSLTRVAFFVKMETAEEWECMTRMQNTHDMKDIFCGWQFEGLVNANLEKLSAARVAVGSALMLVLLNQELQGVVEAAPGISELYDAVASNGPNSKMSLGCALIMCTALEAGVGMEWVGAATSLAMHAANSHTVGSVRSYEKYETLKFRRSNEACLMKWTAELVWMTARLASTRQYRQLVSFDVGGTFRTSLTAFSNLRYYANGCSQRNVKERDWQLLTAIEQLADTQKLHEDSWLEAGKANVFPERHIFNGGERYTPSFAGFRACKNSFFNLELDPALFVTHGLNPKVYTMGCPDYIYDVLRGQLGGFMDGFEKRRVRLPPLTVLDRSPESGRNGFKSSANPDQETGSDIRHTAMAACQERMADALHKTRVTTREMIERMISQLRGKSSKDHRFDYDRLILMFTKTLAKISQLGGDREISLGAVMYQVCSEYMNNLGLAVGVPNDVANWGSNTKQNLMNRMNAFMEGLSSSGFEFKRVVEGATDSKALKTPVHLRPVVLFISRDIKKYAPTMSMTCLAAFCLSIGAWLQDDELCTALMGCLIQSGRECLISRELTDFIEKHKNRVGPLGEKLRHIIKYLNLDMEEIERHKNLGVFTCPGGKVEGAANSFGSALLAILDSYHSDMICQMIIAKIHQDSTITVRDAAGKKVSIRWGSIPIEKQLSICKADSLWCADDGTTFLVLPDESCLPYFISCTNCLNQICNFCLNRIKSIISIAGGELTGFTYAYTNIMAYTVPVVKFFRAGFVYPNTPQSCYRSLMSSIQTLWANGSGCSIASWLFNISGFFCRTRFGITHARLSTDEMAFPLGYLPPLLFGPAIVDPGCLVSVYAPMARYIEMVDVALRAGNIDQRVYNVCMLLVQMYSRAHTYLSAGQVRGSGAGDVGLVDPVVSRTVPSGKILSALGALKNGRSTVLGLLQYTEFLQALTDAAPQVASYIYLSAKPIGPIDDYIRQESFNKTMARAFRFPEYPTISFGMGQLLTIIGGHTIVGERGYRMDLSVDGTNYAVEGVIMTKDEALKACENNLKASYARFAQVTYEDAPLDAVDGMVATVKPTSAVVMQGTVQEHTLTVQGRTSTLVLANMPRHTRQYSQKMLDVSSVVFSLDDIANGSMTDEQLVDAGRWWNTLGAISLPAECPPTTRSIMETLSEMVSLRQRRKAYSMREHEQEITTEDRLGALSVFTTHLAFANAYFGPSSIIQLAAKLKGFLNIEGVSDSALFSAYKSCLKSDRDGRQTAALCLVYEMAMEDLEDNHYTVVLRELAKVNIVNSVAPTEPWRCDAIKHCVGQRAPRVLVLAVHQKKEVYVFTTGETGKLYRNIQSEILQYVFASGYKVCLGEIQAHETGSVFLAKLDPAMVERYDTVMFADCVVVCRHTEMKAIEQLCATEYGLVVPARHCTGEFMMSEDAQVHQKKLRHHPNELMAYNEVVLPTGLSILCKPVRAAASRNDVRARTWHFPQTGWKAQKKAANETPGLGIIVGNIKYKHVVLEWGAEVASLMMGNTRLYFMYGKPSAPVMGSFNPTFRTRDERTFTWAQCQKYHRYMAFRTWSSADTGVPVQSGDSIFASMKPSKKNMCPTEDVITAIMMMEGDRPPDTRGIPAAILQEMEDDAQADFEDDGQGEHAEPRRDDE
jgi:hypothetical protein